MNNRKSQAFSAALISAIVLSVASGATPAVAQSVSLALDSVPDMDNSGTYRWSTTFIDRLNDAGWETETFPWNTIGGEDERLDQTMAGILDINLADYNKAVEYAPAMKVLQVPYLFDNEAHHQRFLQNSDFIAEMNKELESDGLVLLAVVPLGPFNAIFNKKHPIETVEDMSDIRMRALDPAQMEMFSLMGASSVVVPWAEVANAISTGIADGYINPLGVPLTFGHQDLFSHFTDAKVGPGQRVALASRTWFDALNQEEQAQVMQAASEATDEVFAWLPDVDERLKGELADAGFALVEPSSEQLDTFRQATAPMRESVEGVDDERLKEIVAAIDEYR